MRLRNLVLSLVNHTRFLHLSRAAAVLPFFLFKAFPFSLFKFFTVFWNPIEIEPIYGHTGQLKDKAGKRRETFREAREASLFSL